MGGSNSYFIIKSMALSKIKNKKFNSKEFLIESEQLLITLIKNKCLFIFIDMLCNNPIIKEKMEIYKILQKNIIDKKIKTSIELNESMILKNVNSCFVKGFIISQLIYDSPYIRQFEDIDIFLKENDINVAYNSMINMGYIDAFVNKLSDSILVNDDILKKYIVSAYELKLYKCNQTIELKKSVEFFPVNMVASSINSSTTICIGNYEFPTINLEDTFLYLVTNFVSNFYTDWGIRTSYNIRDIIDYCMFSIKYDYIFTELFLNKIKINGLAFYVTLCNKVIINFLGTESVNVLPSTLMSLNDETNDNLPVGLYLDFGNNIITNLADDLKRINKLENTTIKSESTIINMTMIDSITDISKDENFPYSFTFADFIKNALNEEIRLNVYYCHFDLFLKINIPEKINNIRIRVNIRLDNNKFIFNINYTNSNYHITSNSLNIEVINESIFCIKEFLKNFKRNNLFIYFTIFLSSDKNNYGTAIARLGSNKSNLQLVD